MILSKIRTWLLVFVIKSLSAINQFKFNGKRMADFNAYLDEVQLNDLMRLSINLNMVKLV